MSLIVKFCFLELKISPEVVPICFKLIVSCLASSAFVYYRAILVKRFSSDSHLKLNEKFSTAQFDAWSCLSHRSFDLFIIVSTHVPPHYFPSLWLSFIPHRHNRWTSFFWSFMALSLHTLLASHFWLWLWSWSEIYMDAFHRLSGISYQFLHGFVTLSYIRSLAPH